MESGIQGLHHVTPFADNAQKKSRFLRGFLDCVWLKDGGAVILHYHFYYGNEVGEPDHINFFPGKVSDGERTERAWQLKSLIISIRSRWISGLTVLISLTSRQKKRS